MFKSTAARLFGAAAFALGVGSVAVIPGAAQAAQIHFFSHTYGFLADPAAVTIDLRVFDGQPGGKYLWEYTVTNNSFSPTVGSNGFSGFELFLPTPIPEVADVTPNALSVPPWEINCCSGNPIEWDIRNSDGDGILPGDMGVFSFTTDPRAVAINDSGWFHSWVNNGQVDIVPTPGMHVPWVPGLVPLPEPGTLALLGVALAALAFRRRQPV